MRRLALISALILPLAAMAQIHTWKDASGKTHFSNHPPPMGASSREMKASSGDAAATAPVQEKTEPRRVANGPNGGGENRKPEDAPTAKNDEQIKAESEARQKICENARRRLTELQSASLLITQSETGEQKPLVGEARKAKEEATRKEVDFWCSNK